MILNTNQSTVTTVGDIKENQISIDPRNIEHIITILSSNLYSNPEESFLRETISNAIDSHREAGTKEPVILSIKKITEGYQISIRDYGTGISPERFKDIYLCIGSSTKRESNTFIGSFGIGRFSALSCANIVHITSYYNGKSYYYIMVKNGSKINIDEVEVADTAEKNGVEVRIQVPYISAYMGALTSLYYIDELYLDTNITEYNDEIERFKNRHISNFNTFSICNWKLSYYSNSKIVLGSIVYEVDLDKIPFIKGLSYSYRNVFRNLQVRFDIGELDVTPNRETLLYSEKTVEALNTKFKAAAGELKKLYNDKLAACSSNIIEYYRIISSSDFTLCGKEFDMSYTIGGITNECYKGKVVSGSLLYTGLSNILNSDLDVAGWMETFPVIIYSNNFITAKERKKLNFKNLLFNKSINACSVLIVNFDPSDKKRSPKVKEFIRNKYGDDYTLILFTSLPSCKSVESFINYFPLKVYDKHYNSYDNYSTIWLYNELKKALNPTIVFESTSTKEYQDWEKSVKTTKKPIIADKFIRIYWSTSKYYYYKYKIDIKNPQDAIDYIYNRSEDFSKNRVLFGKKDSVWFKINRFFNKAATGYVEVAASNMKYFKDVKLPKNWVRVEDSINCNDPEFIKLMTMHKYKLFVHEDSYSKVWSILPHITPENRRYIEIALNQENYYPDKELYPVLNELMAKFVDSGCHYDTELIEAFRRLNALIDVLDKCKNFMEITTSPEFVTYYAMKKKLLRMNWESYKHIKEKLDITL